MQTRYTNSPNETRGFDTEALREQFLVEDLFRPEQTRWVYSHYDRVMLGGAFPVSQPVTLPAYEALKSDYFLERRELGVINVGSPGIVEVDGTAHEVHKLGCLYIGKGSRQVAFKSVLPQDPARFFLLSAPAHQSHPVRLMRREEASPAEMGSTDTSNQRTIYKYIHQGGIQSCQLVMGLTVLKSGSVWNTMPAHTHDRRMEAYFYFDLPEDQRVFHLMGQPSQTRHLVVANHQAVISPPWSIHSGCGTSNYSFIWGMAGENYTFTDMDFVAMKDLR